MTIFHDTVKFLGQDYDELKRNCLKSRQLYEDTQFKACSSSLSKKRSYDSVVWKRPFVC